MLGVLVGLASIAVQQDQPLVAARLLGGAHTLFEAAGRRAYTYRPDRSLREQTEAAARDRLDIVSWEKAWAEGDAVPVGELVAMGEALADRRGAVRQ